MYDRSAALWQLLFAVLGNIPIELKRHKRRMSIFWAGHQRFFKQLIMACKVGAGRHAGCRGAHRQAVTTA